jgi:hypothetical protein
VPPMRIIELERIIAKIRPFDFDTIPLQMRGLWVQIYRHSLYISSHLIDTIWRMLFLGALNVKMMVPKC